jgi:hypothetical protein
MTPETQAERTRLAWRRTVLLSTVVALLVVRLAVEHGLPWLAPAVVALWLVGALAAQYRIRALARDRERPAGRALSVAVLLTLGYVGLGATVTLLG